MKVTCAGLGKTGTSSLAQALRILGFTVYDYPEHELYHGDEWLSIYYRGKQPDFAFMYKDVDSVTDLPAAFWFQEIYEAFPNAKVVLTIRDNEDVFARSLARQKEVENIKGSWSLTRVAMRWWSHRKHFAIIDAMGSAAFGSLSSKSTVLFKKKYREHNQRVQAVIPEEKLLIFNVKQGWEPLCKFLRCEIPEQPFPRQNIQASKSLEKLANPHKELRLRTADRAQNANQSERRHSANHVHCRSCDATRFSKSHCSEDLNDDCCLAPSKSSMTVKGLK